MQPFTSEKMAAAGSAIIGQCLDLADQIKLPLQDLATLCSTSPATLYRWRKKRDAGTLADPECKMTALAFMNLLIFRQAAQKALSQQALPSDGKKGAQQWVRQLAPDAFDD